MKEIREVAFCRLPLPLFSFVSSKRQQIYPLKISLQAALSQTRMMNSPFLFVSPVFYETIVTKETKNLVHAQCSTPYQNSADIGGACCYGNQPWLFFMPSRYQVLQYRSGSFFPPRYYFVPYISPRLVVFSS